MNRGAMRSSRTPYGFFIILLLLLVATLAIQRRIMAMVPLDAPKLNPALQKMIAQQTDATIPVSCI